MMYCAISEAYSHGYNADDKSNKSIITTTNNNNIPNKNNQLNYHGTAISDLQPQDHNYYINKFISGLIDNNSSYSASQDDYYTHIKRCKFCKKTINSKLLNYFNPQNNFFENYNHKNIKPIKPKKNKNIREYFENKPEKNISELFSADFLGCDFKEIILIILIGIIIIFVLNIILKIGKKI